MIKRTEIIKLLIKNMEKSIQPKAGFLTNKINLKPDTTRKRKNQFPILGMKKRTLLQPLKR